MRPSVNFRVVTESVTKEGMESVVRLGIESVERFGMVSVAKVSAMATGVILYCGRRLK